jgi:putative spermidine/putrescine transport system ATP-binding protein
MSKIRFSKVTKHYGNTEALRELSLTVQDGEFVTLLGPSGCGKTTALRILAGLIQPTSGEVFFDELNMTSESAAKRDIGMVFQAYSLFPNLTAKENMEFGLKARKLSALEIMNRVNELIEVTGLTEHRDKYPHQLSGGQQQRVALVRALAIRPRVLLLDEPLSALDAQVRVQIREEVKRLQREFGITTIFVTHDQEEAMSISDRVGIMEKGELLQIGEPKKLYDSPEHPFVAKFFGKVNSIPVQPVSSQKVRLWNQEFVTSPNSTRRGIATKLSALVRPESIIESTQGKGTLGVIKEISFLGPLTQLQITISNNETVIMASSSSNVSSQKVGEQIWITVSAEQLFVTER